MSNKNVHKEKNEFLHQFGLFCGSTTQQSAAVTSTRNLADTPLASIQRTTPLNSCTAPTSQMINIASIHGNSALSRTLESTSCDTNCMPATSSAVPIVIGIVKNVGYISFISFYLEYFVRQINVHIQFNVLINFYTVDNVKSIHSINSVK